MFEQIVEGGAVVTQAYGCTPWACANRSEWNCPQRGCGCPYGFHAGIDLAQAPGRTPILKAVGYGTRVLRLRQPSSCGGFGPFAVCINAGPVDIWYGHCSKDLVGIGAAVRPDQPVALMGSLGCSNGHHVHLEVQPAGSVDGCRSIDPTPYLTRWPGLPPGPPGPPPPPPSPPGPAIDPWLLAGAAGAAFLAAVASRRKG